MEMKKNVFSKMMCIFGYPMDSSRTYIAIDLKSFYASVECVERGLDELIATKERDGHFYDARKSPDCGMIIISKRAETGLYDPWNGGGSLLEIQLEKDVELPIKFIRSALPDGADGYSISSAYGLCGSAWRNDMVKGISAPGVCD